MKRRCKATKLDGKRCTRAWKPNVTHPLCWQHWAMHKAHYAVLAMLMEKR